MANEKIEEKTEEEKKADELRNTEKGNKSETDKKIEQLNTDTERINQAIAENENAKARQALGGRAEAGAEPEKPKEIDNKEYAEKALAGDYNAEK